jgi:hypothetical protein
VSELRSDQRAVRFHVLFGGVLGVLVGVKTMPVREFCVMRSLLVVASFVVFRGLMVVAGCVLMMFSGLLVVTASFFRHLSNPFHRVVAWSSKQ